MLIIYFLNIVIRKPVQLFVFYATIRMSDKKRIWLTWRMVLIMRTARHSWWSCKCRASISTCHREVGVEKLTSYSEKSDKITVLSTTLVDVLSKVSQIRFPVRIVMENIIWLKHINVLHRRI